MVFSRFRGVGAARQVLILGVIVPRKVYSEETSKKSYGGDAST